MKILPLVAFSISLFGFSSFGVAEDGGFAPPVHTTANPEVRYEILQSARSSALTFRLDRFTGKTWQLYKNSKGFFLWELMPMLEGIEFESDGKARFQLFASGLTPRDTFLLDGRTGKSWFIVKGKRKNKKGKEETFNGWKAFVE